MRWKDGDERTSAAEHASDFDELDGDFACVHGWGVGYGVS